MSRLEDAGATAVLYQPAGPDIPRELRTFYAAAQLRHDLPASTVAGTAIQEVQHA